MCLILKSLLEVSTDLTALSKSGPLWLRRAVSRACMARRVHRGYQCRGSCVFRAGGYVGFVVNLWECVKQSLQASADMNQTKKMSK